MLLVISLFFLNTIFLFSINYQFKSRNKNKYYLLLIIERAIKFGKYNLIFIIWKNSIYAFDLLKIIILTIPNKLFLIKIINNIVNYFYYEYELFSLK